MATTIEASFFLRTAFAGCSSIPITSDASTSEILVGFALETENELENAKAKLKKKNLNLIVLNSLKDKGAGFKTETNKVTIIDNKNRVTEYQLKSKSEVAKDLLNEIIKQLDE